MRITRWSGGRTVSLWQSEQVVPWVWEATGRRRSCAEGHVTLLTALLIVLCGRVHLFCCCRLSRSSMASFEATEDLFVSATHKTLSASLLHTAKLLHCVLSFSNVSTPRILSSLMSRFPPWPHSPRVSRAGLQSTVFAFHRVNCTRCWLEPASSWSRHRSLSGHLLSPSLMTWYSVCPTSFCSIHPSLSHSKLPRHATG